MIQIAYKKGIYTLLALCLLNAPALAQDCNGTYEEGMALLKKRTQSAVKQAVRKFKSAQLCYKVNREEEGIRTCDPHLTECQQILNYYTRQAARLTTEEELTFPASGGTQTLPVKGRKAWSFTGSRDWCSATKTDEGLAVTVEQNPAPIRRSQTITLQANGTRQLVKIIQEGSELRITLSENDIYFMADDVEKRIGVTSNVEWTIEEASLPEWCSVRTDKEAIYLTPAFNPSPDERRGTIVLRADSKRETLRLIQGVENFRILTGSNSDTLSFLRNGGRRTLGIEYTVNKNSKAWEVESYPNWCKATKESDNALLIECNKNKAKTGRTGIVRLRKGQRIIPLIIEQSTEKESLKQRLFGK